MKKLTILLIGLMAFVLNSEAQRRQHRAQSQFQLMIVPQGFYEIHANGRIFTSSGGLISKDIFRPGVHHLKIVQIFQGRNGRQFRNLVFKGQIFIPANTLVKTRINRHGQFVLLGNFPLINNSPACNNRNYRPYQNRHNWFTQPHNFAIINEN